MYLGGAALSLNQPVQRFYRDIRAGFNNPPMNDVTLARLSKQAWTLTVRAGSKVRHEHFESLEAAVDALAVALVELEDSSERDEFRFFNRRKDCFARYIRSCTF